MTKAPSQTKAWLFLLLVAVAGSSLVTAACGSKTGLLIDGVATHTTTPSPTATSTTAPAAVTCTNGTFSLTAAQAEVMFVIDRSGSMAFNLSGGPAAPTNPSRWSQLSDALTPVLQSIQSTVQMGAKFFPEAIDTQNFDTATACELDPTIDVEPALNNAQPILGIFTSTEPRGGTPTAAAITTTATLLQQGNTRAVSQFMVLATDGAPNCAPDGKDPNTCICTDADPTECATDATDDGAYSCLDDTATVAAIQAANDSLHIPTFVIGIGQDQPQFDQVLDAMAVAGGRPRDATPSYYPVLVPQDLTDAFTQIQASITQCTFVTPSEPDNPDAIDILVNGQPVAHDTTHTNGWDYVNATFGEIELYGNACALAKADATGVTAVVDCTKQ